MFLKKTQRKYKDKVYQNYSIARSYRKDGRVKHKTLYNLGSLTPEEVETFQLILKAKRIDDLFVGSRLDVVAKKQYYFLGVAVLDCFW